MPIFLPCVIIDNTLQFAFEHKTTVNKKKKYFCDYFHNFDTNLSKTNIL
jgi:hypothetical protein